MADSTVFEGRAPGGSGSMVELKDGRWLRVWSGLNASYSNDRGRTWSASEPLQTGNEPIIGTGAPTCLVRLQSGKLGLLYGRFSGTAGGTLAGYALCFRTSDDEAESWSEETAINLPGETASNYHDVLFPTPIRTLSFTHTVLSALHVSGTQRCRRLRHLPRKALQNRGTRSQPGD